MKKTVNGPGADGAAPLSLADRAYRSIRDRLVMLDIRPGAPIKEDQIATSLGIGRTPVREALKRLESEHLVVAHSRRGTFASDVNITDLAHISEIRLALEPTAAAAAARRATASDRESLGELLAELNAGGANADGPESAMRLDLRVHRAVYTATHNPYLESTLINYGNLATRIWCLFLDRLPDVARHVDEHAALIQAIIDRDADKASLIAANHVSGFERAIRALL